MNFTFMFPNCHRKEDILRLNQSLRILSNLVAADAITHVGREDIMFELLGLTSVLLSQKKTDNLDMIAKVFNLYFLLHFACLCLSDHETCNM